MSQVIAGCCCGPPPVNPCPIACADRTVTPNTVSIEVPFEGLGYALCSRPYCYPATAPDFIPFTSPVGSVQAHLCYRETMATYAGNSYVAGRSWLYRSTPIEVGQISEAYGYFSGPCKTYPVFMHVRLFQICNGLPGNVANPINTLWTLYIIFYKGIRADGAGFCDGQQTCVPTPVDFAANPCFTYTPPNQPGVQLDDVPFILLPLNQVGFCSPNATPGQGMQSQGFFETLRGSGGVLRGFPPPSHVVWDVLEAYHSNWIYDSNPSLDCNPRGRYDFLQDDGSIGSLVVT